MNDTKQWRERFDEKVKQIQSGDYVLDWGNIKSFISKELASAKEEAYREVIEFVEPLPGAHEDTAAVLKMVVRHLKSKFLTTKEDENSSVKN